jgi:hypothetical protein
MNPPDDSPSDASDPPPDDTPLDQTSPPMHALQEGDETPLDQTKPEMDDSFASLGPNGERRRRDG